MTGVKDGVVIRRGRRLRADATLILAHGAGAGQPSPFIVRFARALAGLGVDIVTFNFLYTEQRRRIPDRAPQLEACYRAAVMRTRSAEPSRATLPLFVGGKSMGGRIATQVAAADPSLRVSGLVLLGYPLHPPGKPNQRRDAHLPRSAARCSSHRVAATHSARRRNSTRRSSRLLHGPTFTWSAAAITRSRWRVPAPQARRR